MRRAPAVLLVLALAGCGTSAKDTQRREFNRYVESVNRIETDAAAAWRRAQSAYSKLGGGRLTAAELRELAAAPPTIRSLRRRLAAVEPPPRARRLHASLVHLLDLDASFADEVAGFGRYVTAVRPLERALTADSAALSAELKRTRSRAAEDAALARFARRVGVVERRLGALHPPPAFAPWHAEQLDRTHALRAGAQELRHGLARRDRAAIEHGFATLRDAANRASVTVADRAAIVAYDARLAQIRRVTDAVAREESRLARSLR